MKEDSTSFGREQKFRLKIEAFCFWISLLQSSLGTAIAKYFTQGDQLRAESLFIATEIRFRRIAQSSLCSGSQLATSTHHKHIVIV